MLSDLLSIDIFTLAVATDWSEEHKKGLSDQYSQALAITLEDKLRSHLSAEQVTKIDALAEDPQTTDLKIIEFYTKNIPHIEEVIENISLEFKKEFLLKLYDNYCTEFGEEIKHLKKQPANDQTEQLIAKSTQAQLHWEHVLHLAKADEWNDVRNLLTTSKN